jgi:RNase P/RNase MRP subunit p29
LKLNPDNVLSNSIIGVKARIYSPFRAFKPVYGTIIDESQNTITVLTHNGIKKLLKKFSVLRLYLNNEYIIEVNGEGLVGTLAERIKRRGIYHGKKF